MHLTITIVHSCYQQNLFISICHNSQYKYTCHLLANHLLLYHMGTWTRIAIFISWLCATLSDEMVGSEIHLLLNQYYLSFRWYITTNLHKPFLQTTPNAFRGPEFWEAEMSHFVSWVAKAMTIVSYHSIPLILVWCWWWYYPWWWFGSELWPTQKSNRQQELETVQEGNRWSELEVVQERRSQNCSWYSEQPTKLDSKIVETFKKSTRKI